MSKEYKITFIGDIMGELPVFNEAKRPDGSFDFYPTLAPLKSLFDEADYGVGNLETVLAGEEAEYTKNIVSFNSPDSFADAVKAIGIDAVTTANNHIMDRGLEGLIRTTRVLKEKGLAFTGTYDEEPEDRNLYFTLGDTRIALISCTVSVNKISRYDYSEIYKHANLLRDYRSGLTRPPEDPIVKETRAKREEEMGRKLSFEEMALLRRELGQPVAYADEVLSEYPVEPFLEETKRAYERARSKSDVVIICPHSGGQFNTEPGSVSRFYFEKFAGMGFDAIIAAHSHTTQRVDVIKGVPVFNSLGNVTMSPMTGYSEPATLPTYGMAAHLYIAEGKISHYGFSLFKMIHDEHTPLHTVPVDDYIKTIQGEERNQLLSEVAQVYERITGRKFTEIRHEWPL